MNVTALIADDEMLARQRLRDLLEDHPWVHCVAETSNGPATVERINEIDPDLVFLDIQMPGFFGLDVLDRIETSPHIVFTTAFAEYAVAAFELNALDYLLKPFGPERFAVALDRVKLALEYPRAGASVDRARNAFRDGPQTRLFIRRAGSIIPLAVSAVVRIEARGDYVAIVTSDDRHIVHLTMNELERRLDPERFVRIHRTHMVNLDYVISFSPYDSTRLQVELAGGTRIVASRARSKVLRRLGV